jgi:uncharacterized protein (TIGR02246 family)
MKSHAVEQELLELEKQFWQAIKDKNAEATARLSDDPCLITGAQGVGRIDKQAMMGLTKAQSYTLHDFRISDPQVRLLGDEVAVLAYNVHEELTVEGKPVTIDAADASTWVRRDGRWVCALHTESLKGDPFGRDRGRGASS